MMHRTTYAVHVRTHSAAFGFKPRRGTAFALGATMGLALMLRIGVWSLLCILPGSEGLGLDLPVPGFLGLHALLFLEQLHAVVVVFTVDAV